MSALPTQIYAQLEGKPVGPGLAGAGAPAYPLPTPPRHQGKEPLTSALSFPSCILGLSAMPRLFPLVI